MKACILLCDAARLHHDGTVSLLRGGITRVQGKPGKVRFRGSIFIRIKLTGGEFGSHTVHVVVLNADGNPIAPRIEGHFDAGPGRMNAVNLAMDVSLQLPEAGSYSFRVNVDGHEMDVWEFEAVETTEQEDHP